MELSGQLHATAALPPGERAAVTHWIGGRMSPRAGLDTVTGGNFPAGNRTPVVQPVE
jgi:hypothetical protein